MFPTPDHAGSGFDGSMMALTLPHANAPLDFGRVPIPPLKPGQMLLRVKACGVCRTDLHIVDGELPAHKSPLIPGHEIVGEVVCIGDAEHGFSNGDRVGVPWMGHTCGQCYYCSTAQENLCDHPQFTGYDRDGGYAEYVAVDPAYCFRIPDSYDDLHAAPLLCAGLIGYRAYSMVSQSTRLGLYGFGAAAHILAQIALYQGKKVYAFTRPGDVRTQEFARSLGVNWAGDANAKAPMQLDAAILFAPSGELIPQALAATRKGATVVCAGIHMSQIPAFSYDLLWGERCLRSVANLTRADGEAFFALAAQIPLKVSVTRYAMQNANAALDDLRAGNFEGAAVLTPD
jgi:propanol-preferring alcohol dehydrogenase